MGSMGMIRKVRDSKADAEAAKAGVQSIHWPGGLCSHCDSLKSGTGAWLGPHPYLVAISVDNFVCWLCDSRLARISDSRWALSKSRERSTATGMPILGATLSGEAGYRSARRAAEKSQSAAPRHRDLA
jgi:hypothetical protein